MAGKKGRSGPQGLGKTAPKRTLLQRETDRAEMLRLLRRGHTQAMVAEKLGVHRTQISYDFRLVMRRLAEQLTEDTKAIRAAKLEEYAEVKREAWGAWERSRQEAQKKVKEAALAPDGTGRKKVVETTAGQYGDPRFLQTVLDCLKAERDLLGVNLPEELTVRGSVVNWDVFSQGMPANGPIPDVVELEVIKVLGFDLHANSGHREAVP